eukprot:6203992-Pleurochrysis_carterae.AAC.1
MRINLRAASRCKAFSFKTQPGITGKFDVAYPMQRRANLSLLIGQKKVVAIAPFSACSRFAEAWVAPTACHRRLAARSDVVDALSFEDFVQVSGHVASTPARMQHGKNDAQ